MAWTRLIHAYLTGRPNLRRVYVLVDGRHGPKANDLSLMNELDKAAVSYQIVLTKADKPRGNDLEKVIAGTKAAIAKRPAAHPELIVTSSEKGAPGSPNSGPRSPIFSPDLRRHACGRRSKRVIAPRSSSQSALSAIKIWASGGMGAGVSRLPAGTIRLPSA